MLVTWRVFAVAVLVVSQCGMFAYAKNHIEINGNVVIEAEHFATQHKDDKRRWMIFSEKSFIHNYADSDKQHSKNASNGQYIELLPDTRTNHHEPLIRGENFTNIPGDMAVLSYPVYFQTKGTYYVWARAFSTGSEDNGIHVGLNGTWPETAQRLQLCEGKHQWTWSSAQRRKDNHCGIPNTITLHIPSPGVHTIMVSMREDGFELDKLFLTTDSESNPTVMTLVETVTTPNGLPQKSILLGIEEYTRIFYAATDFTVASNTDVSLTPDLKLQTLGLDSSTPYYLDKFGLAQVKLDKKDAGIRTITLVAITEKFGSSRYQVILNNKVIGEFTKLPNEKANQEVYFHLYGVELKAGDMLSIASMSVSPNNTTENISSGFSHGLWRALVLSKENKNG